MIICEVNHLNKSFGSHHVIHDFSWNFEQGKITCISGPSGAGKTTLLNLIGLLESSDSGELILFDQKITRHFHGRRKLLFEKIGYLFQDYALLEEKTVEFNLNMALEGHHLDHKQERIQQALQAVGLEGYQKKLVNECSGGEQQRIAIARLLLKPCELILADEPTGSLDEENKKKVFQLLQECCRQGKTVILVTHDDELKALSDTVVELQPKSEINPV